VFGPMARRHTLDGKALLVGGVLYVVYLLIVTGELLGVIHIG